MLHKLKKLAQIALEPIEAETKSNHKVSWERLPEALHTPRQMYGTHGHNCGATIGAMPRCDFACQGCYLGEGANKIPAQPIEEIKRQMRVLRPVLGVKGNIQITDGEVTLRPAEEVIDLIRYARSLDMIPMLMTHGDSFRRQPGLLERFMDEGGLSEVSIHVDTDMRGRKGAAYKNAKEEHELNPLRDEFAEILRTARKKTGKKIAAATTMTVTEHNLKGVPDVMRWLRNNSDVFKMISFQPIAQVGRTEEGLGGGVDVEELWKKIAEGLYENPADHTKLGKGAMWMGHSACNRYVLGTVIKRPNQDGYFEPFCDFDNPDDLVAMDTLRDYFGGINFRADGPMEAAARVLGCFAKAPTAIASLVPHVVERLRRFDAQNPYGLLLKVLQGEVKLSGLNIVSHHFMSNEELQTPLGQERLGLCMFKVPIGEQLYSMCQVNATGLRDQYYAEIQAGKRPSVQPKKRLPTIQV